MTKEEIFKEYKENICPYCKGKCEKGVVVVTDDNVTYGKCVDYEKDKDKIEGYKRPIERAAKLERTVMDL